MRPLALVSLLALTACGTGTADASQVYTSNCAACHGAQGEGNAAGPPLAGLDLTADEIRSAILEGVDERPDFPAMGPVRGLDSTAIEQIVAHVQSLEG
jgi:mono/diheme cytochrome c family protein